MRSRLVVRQAITTVDHEPTVGDVKSTRSRRAIDLDPVTVNFRCARNATHLLAAGTNVRVTSERLGHASVAFTLDVYGHVLPGQQADAAAAVAALVDG
jgi:integrase